MIRRNTAQGWDVRRFGSWYPAELALKGCLTTDRLPVKPMVKALVKSRHNVCWYGNMSVCDRPTPYVTPAYTNMDEVTRPALTVAKKPDVSCDLRIGNICNEICPNIDLRGVLGKTPKVLRRKIMPMIRDHFVSLG